MAAEHYKPGPRVVGVTRGTDGLVHVAEEREFKSTSMRVMFEHCTDNAIYPENLIDEDTPISCIFCLTAPSCVASTASR